ncbi:unnamed protein product [Didymodactylos carnosus]|uniref:Uncharacterized protein n=1 Tax=Didymodactylos carnosus TaxID=1234261 RepID=A0A8S2U2Z6_9BILA|nr:unnamed protein product [Didymodactylos carnosus]CAF4318824.1 unnamed protein product [Didymodactylos carnosus]
MKQLEGIANNQQCDEILINIQHMLELATSKYAIDEWKQIMIKVLKHCFKNENILLINNKQLNDLKETVKSSPMFSKKLWKTQMLPCYDTCGEDGQQEEKLPTKGSPLNGDTNTYADLFSKLESSDPLLNENVLTDLRTILENEQLPSTISMKKYISALKYVFKNVEKFSLNSNIDKWLNLVRKNRKKLFVDQQCDQLLMTLIFLKLNLTDHSLTTINYLIKSRKRSECVEGLRLLGKILDYNDSQYVCKTMGDELFKMIVNVAYNERFNTDDVKKALKYCQNYS